MIEHLVSKQEIENSQKFELSETQAIKQRNK